MALTTLKIFSGIQGFFCLHSGHATNYLCAFVAVKHLQTNLAISHRRNSDNEAFLLNLFASF